MRRCHFQSKSYFVVNSNNLFKTFSLAGLLSLFKTLNFLYSARYKSRFNYCRQQNHKQIHFIQVYNTILVMIEEKNHCEGTSKNTERRHIVVLTGATFQGSGVNFYILNNAIRWKRSGMCVTVICQDRNAKNMNEIDSYIVGELKHDTPKLKPGQIRVIIPDINNLIPIYATFQYCQFEGMKCKPVQQMTDEEIQTNISMTAKCLKQVCQHDRPYKVIANYMICSGIIAARGLQGLNIPYDIIVPGPALTYSVKPYPHLWKWVLPGFKKASYIFQHTEFVKIQFLKCFNKQIQQYKLDVKVKAVPPGMDPCKVKIPESYKKCQQQFLQSIRQKIKIGNPTYSSVPKQEQAIVNNNLKKTQTDKKQKAEKINELLLRAKSSNTIQSDLLDKWIPYSDQDQTVLYVGALRNSQGMGQLLAIALKLITKRPNLKFIFCGSGPMKEHMKQLINAYQQDDFQKAKIVAQNGQFITQLNIQDYFFNIDQKIRNRIIFAGLLDGQTINKLLPLCTLYVVPSKKQQSTSLSILEAMCCGLTPILNDHSWMNEVLNAIERQYPQLSKIIRVDRSQFFDKLPQTIINTLEFIKRNPLSKKQYRERIRKICSDNFSWEHTAQILAEPRQFAQFP